MILFFKCLPRLFRQAGKDMRRHFTLIFSSALSIAIALLISMLMFVLAWNVSFFTQNIEDSLVVQVSINPTLSNEQIDQLQEQIESLKEVDSITYSNKEQELQKLIDDYGDTFSQYQGDDRNPLYDVFILELNDTTSIDSVTEEIRSMDGVIDATYGTGTVNQMVQLFSTVRYGGIIFVIALIFLSIFLIRNTVKLAIQVRKEEIRIMRQVGAYNWYITVPFVLEGMMTGFLGALVPALLCLFGYTSLYNALGGFFMSEMFVLIPPYPFVIYVAIVLFGVGIFVGMFGSYLASRKYLRWSR